MDAANNGPIHIKDLGILKIDCSNLSFYETYAQCHVRDDISSNLRKTFMMMFAISFLLLVKNIMNLITIQRADSFKKVKDMAVINIILLPTILLQMLLYANSFWLEMDMSGYSLFVYGLIEIAQVLALNNLFSLGAYFWIKTMFRLSFNNARIGIVKAIFILCTIMNFVFFLVISIFFYSQKMTDTTLWIEVEGVTRLMYILVTLSTLVNGLFFSLGLLIASKISRTTLKQDPSNRNLVTNLALLAALVSLLRVAQDLIQSFGTVLANIKFNSVINNDWNFPLYLTFFLFIANIIPEGIFLIKYCPQFNSKTASHLDTSSTNPSDDHMFLSKNKSITLLISE